MGQRIANPVQSAIMMHLPPVVTSGIVCENLTCLASHFLTGNGFCNDEANNAECNFDGGDCCGSCVNTEFCIECICLGNITSNEFSNPLIGNGFCNDHTNNALCGFDGFDCCGANVIVDVCTECACHGKVLSLLKGCKYLIASPSPSVKIQIKGGKIVKKSWVQIPTPEGQYFYPSSFHFQILHTKLDNMCKHYHYLVLQIRYQHV
jgi:hypothetical protein